MRSRHNYKEEQTTQAKIAGQNMQYCARPIEHILRVQQVPKLWKLRRTLLARANRIVTRKAPQASKYRVSGTRVPVDSRLVTRPS